MSHKLFTFRETSEYNWSEFDRYHFNERTQPLQVKGAVFKNCRFVCKRFLPDFPSPYPPLSFFGSCPIFRMGKTLKILFLNLSLLPNPMETLAKQASIHSDGMI